MLVSQFKCATAYQPHKGYSEEVKRECLKMYVNGMVFEQLRGLKEYITPAL